MLESEVATVLFVYNLQALITPQVYRKEVIYTLVLLFPILQIAGLFKKIDSYGVLK